LNEDLVETLRTALSRYTDPDLPAALGELALFQIDPADDGPARVIVGLTFPADRFGPVLAERLAGYMAQEIGPGRCELEVHWDIPTAPVQGGKSPLPGVRNVIAVASGKGGVGKSTTAVNLALALAAEGARVGMLDADIYGPSQPTMLGLEGRRPTSPDGRSLDPMVAHGLQCMSMGFLVGPDQPVIWRGPMATQALNQLLGQTRWDDLDYLIVDMPPGTGDIQLTLAQQVPVSGAVIITTPQDIALIDAIKGLKMFQDVEVPVLGVIENMSTHVCSKCGHEEAIFGTGGGARMSDQHGLPLLGGLPLDLRIREDADGGMPSVVADPEGNIARAYMDVARRMTAALSMLTDTVTQGPRIVIEDD
jgi:ATP-binding protein involved in chromosome partitioning